MVDSVKNYGITGVSGNIELGKEYKATIVSSDDDISLFDRNNDLNRAKIADGENADQAQTLSQLENININRTFSNVISYDSSTTNMIVVPANTTVLSVSIEALTNWAGADANTNITIGDSSDPDRLFTHFDPTVPTVDETNHLYSNRTTLRSTVTQGGATSGTARVMILYSGGTLFAAPQNQIDTQTEINIFFDSSGSMNSSLTPLRTMKNDVLKNALLPFYDDDGDAYDNNVSFTEESNERVWSQMETLGTNANVTQVINLVFSDENSPYGATSSYLTVPNTQHTTDITSLRSTIATAETANGSSYFRSVLFQVNTGPGSYTGYKNYVNAVINGTGNYSGNAGLSDRANVEVRVETDVIAGANATYYANQVISGLNSLGYSIPSVSYD
jgi:hypothetical protein